MLMPHAYPEVKMTDKEILAMSPKTTAGFKHHKLKVCFQSPTGFSACIIRKKNDNNRETMKEGIFVF